MFDFFDKLLAKLSAIVDWFGHLVTDIFKSIFVLLKDVLIWAFDQFLTLVVSIVSSLGLGSIGSGFSTSAIPASVLEVLSALGLGTALSWIVAAIVIRLTLQLIPFTRLGS